MGQQVSKHHHCLDRKNRLCPQFLLFHYCLLAIPQSDMNFWDFVFFWNLKGIGSKPDGSTPQIANSEIRRLSKFHIFFIAAIDICDLALGVADLRQLLLARPGAFHDPVSKDKCNYLCMCVYIYIWFIASINWAVVCSWHLMISNYIYMYIGLLRQLIQYKYHLWYCLPLKHLNVKFASTVSDLQVLSQLVQGHFHVSHFGLKVGDAPGGWLWGSEQLKFDEIPY